MADGARAGEGGAVSAATTTGDDPVMTLALPKCTVDGCGVYGVWKESFGWLHVPNDPTIKTPSTAAHRALYPHQDDTGHEPHADFLGDW